MNDCGGIVFSITPASSRWLLIQWTRMDNIKFWEWAFV